MGNAAPLALLRQIRLTSRAIKNRARLIEHYRGEGREDEADTARHALVPDIALYLRLTDWLASLGYTPPSRQGCTRSCTATARPPLLRRQTSNPTTTWRPLPQVPPGVMKTGDECR